MWSRRPALVVTIALMGVDDTKVDKKANSRRRKGPIESTNGCSLHEIIAEAEAKIATKLDEFHQVGKG